MQFNQELNRADRKTNINGLAKSQIVQSLADQLGSHVVEMWFDNGHSILVENQTVRITSSNDFQLGRIKTRFGAQLRRAIRNSCGAETKVVFELKEEVADRIDEPQIKKFPVKDSGSDFGQTAPSKDSVELKRKQRGTDSFWFGETNKIVEAGVDQVFDSVGQISPFVIYGPTGSGKTHLLESMVYDARRVKRLKRCVYLSAEQFTTNFVEALRGTGLPLFRRKYRDLDVLAIDDVQFFGGKSATLAEFQYTVDHLVRNGRQVILASDRAPVELGALGSELSARMVSGLVCPLNYPDAIGRSRIVKEICRQRGYDIPDEIQDLISQNLARDVRRLSGALNRVHALSIANGGQLSVETAKSALTDLFSINGTVTSMNNIEKVVCDFCGVKPSELKSSSRQKRISAARMLAMYLSRHYTANACSEIGDYFGGRSHSTVIAAEKKVAHWLRANEAIDLPHTKYPAKDAVIRIESKLRIG